MNEISTEQMLNALELMEMSQELPECMYVLELEAIRAALLERDALVADNIRLKAEVERLATEASHHQHDAFYAEKRAEKAEAALAEARPLIEAAGYLKMAEDGHFTSTYKQRAVSHNEEVVLKAALAYRIGQGKKEGGNG